MVYPDVFDVVCIDDSFVNAITMNKVYKVLETFIDNKGA